jgi:hypothetical protein
MAASKTRTRGKGSVKTAAEAVAATASTAPKVSLKPDSSNPPKVFILPKDASPAARIVNLANPKTTSDTRYFCCPEKGFYEFTKVSEPRTTPRSWLLVSSDGGEGDGKRQNDETLAQRDDGEYSSSQGYVTKNAEMFIATPIDPMFLVLPALATPISPQESESTKRLFLASEEYFDNIVSKSRHLRTLLRTGSTQKRIELRMAAVCDTVEAGDDTMYRLNETKLLQELLRKAKRMVEYGLPSSMEEKFVIKVLEVPMLNLKREESSILEGVEEGERPNASSVSTPATDSVDSQISTSSTDTLTTSASFVSTAATSVSGAGEAVELPNPTPEAPTISAPEGIPQLLRVRTALNFIITSYLPSHLQRTLQTILQSPSPATVDFTPLDQHLSHLADLRQQALASRSLGDYSRKRTLDEDEETRADKKRKKDEEEKKRKAGESRGVRDLKKVNVKGMKKMSDFFAKKS